MRPSLKKGRKSAANRRNAQLSTGPRTAAGKSAASLNALKHGLNTPVPDYMLRACRGQYGDLINHAGPAGPDEDADLVYALAARARLPAHRARLMQTIVAFSGSEDGATAQDLTAALAQLGRLHTYERKSLSRLASLLKDR